MLVELSLLTLHGEHAATTLCQEVGPPRLFGTTWSNVRSALECLSPQYWQRKRSRRNTLNRVSATCLGTGWYLRSASTDGSRIVVDGLRTTVSYSSTTQCVASTTALIARSHRSSDSGK